MCPPVCYYYFMDISVITVSYNVAELLKNCIESVLKYTEGIEYEIIIVDNRKTINFLKGEETESWIIGWSEGKTIYVLNKDNF